MAHSLDDLETSSLGRTPGHNATAALVAVGMGICAVLFAAWIGLSVLPSVIDAVSARPVACDGYSAAECTALAEGGW